MLKSALGTLLGARPSREMESLRDRPAETILDGDDVGARCRVLIGLGRLPDALRTIDAAIARQPSIDDRLRFARADVLRAWGRWAEALQELELCAPDRVVDGDALHAMAWLAMKRGHADEAVNRWRQALARDSKDRDAAVGLGSALLAKGKRDDAAAAYREALQHTPHDVEATVGLAQCLIALGQNDEAEAILRRTLDANPDDKLLLQHLAVLLANAHRDDESFELLARAESSLSGDPGDAEPYANYAIGLCNAGRLREGIVMLEDGLPIRPDMNGYLQLGHALLAMGEFREGWRQYEHRWLVPPFTTRRADYGVPQWMGQPLEGETILVCAEQGIGDVFQFARYLPMLKARGAHVLFQPLYGMDAVGRLFPGVDHIVKLGEKIPPFAYYTNLMSLPLAFGTTVDTIPCDIPYLSPDPDVVQKWAPRLAKGDEPLVGVIWAGRPTHARDIYRSLRLEQLRPLLDCSGVRFVSLQKGPSVVQAEAIPEKVDWIGLGPELDELDDAVAVLSMLDLLICVDTGPAHMAGAMGKPVWMMLPTPADFRWLTEREDTPWYPTLRLFRQKTPRQWDPVIADVAQELRKWADAWHVGRKKDQTMQPAIRAVHPGAVAKPVERSIKGIAIAAETRAGFLQFNPDEPVGRSLDLYGEWTYSQLELLLRLIRPGATIVEAGSGVGTHTIPLARAIGVGGLLFAYEARPAFRRLLAGNLATHGISNVSVMTRALEAPDPAGFTSERETIDDLGLARLDGLKVNAGADANAILAGAQETLWRCRPWLMLSADLAPLEHMRETLREFGYRVWKMDTPLYSPTNFNRRSENVFGDERSIALFALPEEIDLRESLAGCEEWP